MANLSNDPLMDGISSVELIDAMGGDIRVCNAARVSFNKQKDFFEDGDERLLDFLAREKHFTPFTHVMCTFRIKMPIFIARQWFKHQVGFTRNEVSRRYVDYEPEFFIPDMWRLRAKEKKQGSSNQISLDSSEVSNGVKNLSKLCAETYEYLMEEKIICPEQARSVLPQNMYTEFYETASLAGYARIMSLRDKPDAQLEIQQYAKAVDNLIKDVAPYSWEALKKHA